MTEYRLTEAGRIGLRMLLDAETLYRADRNGLHLLGMEDVVDLPDEWVEPVPPPLPPQPEPGIYEARRPGSSGQWLLQRRAAHPDTWRMAGHEGWLSWAEVLQIVPGAIVTRLVPAPEPVTLPWYGKSDLGGELIVAPPVPESRYRLVPLAVNGTATTVSPDVARAMAAALLSAADQVERAS